MTPVSSISMALNLVMGPFFDAKKTPNGKGRCSRALPADLGSWAWDPKARVPEPKLPWLKPGVCVEALTDGM